MITDPPQRVGIIIVGGGLSGGLLALALARHNPDMPLLLLEQGERFGGNHIWSFFDGDIDAQDRELLAPLISGRWENGYDVAFPGHKRRLTTPYNSIRSDRFDTHIRAKLGPYARSACTVKAMTPTSVTLDDGQVLHAGTVIDARGTAPSPNALDCGWQKFVGQMVRVRGGHGVDRPTIMDATVDQIDGFRFVYLLPFDAETLFVEDTYYSDDPHLDDEAVRLRIDNYIRSRGWARSLLHEETGVLPVVKGGRFADVWPSDDGIARCGSGAGLYHPLTSYSLPEAVRFARFIVDGQLTSDGRLAELGGKTLAQATRAYAADRWNAGGHYRMLARMLFDAADPDQRYRVLQRFYRLPEPLIRRFYAGQSTLADKARILAGKPPVPLARAVRSLLGKRP